MRSEAFSIGMWSGAGFEKAAKGGALSAAARKLLTAKSKKAWGAAHRPLKPRAGGGVKTPKAPPAEPGLLEQVGDLTPTKLGLGLGVPAGLLGYLAGSGMSTPRTPSMPPMSMQGMYGMPGMYNQPAPPMTGY
jgi:hypothetical protein